MLVSQRTRKSKPKNRHQTRGDKQLHTGQEGIPPPPDQSTYETSALEIPSRVSSSATWLTLIPCSSLASKNWSCTCAIDGLIDSRLSLVNLVYFLPSPFPAFCLLYFPSGNQHPRNTQAIKWVLLTPEEIWTHISILSSTVAIRWCSHWLTRYGRSLLVPRKKEIHTQYARVRHTKSR